VYSFKSKLSYRRVSEGRAVELFIQFVARSLDRALEISLKTHGGMPIPSDKLCVRFALHIGEDDTARDCNVSLLRTMPRNLN